MSSTPTNTNGITIAVSARVLFNMEGMDHESEPFSQGPAFSFVKVLMEVNRRLKNLNPESNELFHVVMTEIKESDHLRLSNTIRHYGIAVENAPDGVNADLYLYDDQVQVRQRLQEGKAAATMFMQGPQIEVSQTQLRLAFDGDGVLFSDESERKFKQGLQKFLQHEKENECYPIGPGPFKGFQEALGRFQNIFYNRGQYKDCPIRTYLVTSRDAGSSGIRALKTLRSPRRDLKIDEAFFLCGSPKGPMLEKIRPHLFFDDKMEYVTEAQNLGIVACHVPYGIHNE